MQTTMRMTMTIMRYMTREQFYLVAVNLVSNKGKLLALGNMGFVFAILFGKLLIKMFLGSLREEEWENLNDRLSSTFIDTLLAMTIFRENFNAAFVALFVLLLSSKIFHWTIQDRVDYIERTPALSRFTYLRVFTFIFSLAMFDLCFVFYSISATKTRGPSVMLLFGFEYAVLFALAVQSMVKFFLNLEDLRREGRWDQKGAIVLYLDFIVDMFKLVIYFLFFSFVMLYYGTPFHLIRQVYMTFRSFQRRVRELIQYRRATANMHQRFPDATAEEIANAHGVCIVCREEMVTDVLHFHCLRSWLERSQTCPMCTASVLETPQQRQQQQQQQQQPQAQAQAQAQAQQQPPHPHPQQPQQRPMFPFNFPNPFNPPPPPPPPAQPQQPAQPNHPASSTGGFDPHMFYDPNTIPLPFDPQQQLNLPYDPLLHIEQIQQHLQMLQLETQFLWQSIYMQQQMFGMNNNNNNINPNFNPNVNFYNFDPSNNNNNNNNNNNSNNNNNNSNNNNSNTRASPPVLNNANVNNESNINSNNNNAGSVTSSMPRMNSEDELLNKVLQESASAQHVTPPSPRSTTTSSTSLPSPSPSPTSTSATPDDEDKDSMRRRRLMKFSSSNE